MTIRFTLTRGGEITIFEPGHHGHAKADIRAELEALLVRKGVADEWDADDLGAAAFIQRVWYSPVGGWGHDCSLHEVAEAGPQCEGMHPCILVTGLPPWVIDKLAEDGELNTTE